MHATCMPILWERLSRALSETVSENTDLLWRQQLNTPTLSHPKAVWALGAQWHGRLMPDAALVQRNGVGDPFIPDCRNAKRCGAHPACAAFDRRLPIRSLVGSENWIGDREQASQSRCLEQGY